MKIIGIYPRKKSLVGLCLSEEFHNDYAIRDKDGYILIDYDFSLEAGLKEDMEISSDDMEEIILESHKKRAKNKALWFISRRSYASGELRKKLLEEFPDFAVDFAIKRLMELSLINDLEYARALARNLIEIKGNSPFSASYLMGEKGLDKEIIRTVLEEREDNPKEIIHSIIEKKYLKDINSEKGLKRAINSLLRKGFSYSDIRSVLRDYKSDEISGDFGD